MGELKPIGSEKLSGDAKIKRILELTYYQSNNEPSRSKEVVKETKSGVYGIVKEKDGYYVKQGLNENSLDYIGGMFMKNKNRFSSYGEALKKLEFLTEQDNLQEATRYVLKQNKPEPKPQDEAPAPMPTTDAAPAPAPAPEPDPMGGDVPSAPEADPMGGEGTPEDPNDFMKVVQKMTGRLTQKLSTYQDKMESKDIKYVINMVLAALDLDKLDEADYDEIISKFEDDEEGMEGSSDIPTDGNGEVPAAPESEVKELDGIASLDELINTPLEDDDYGYEGGGFDDIETDDSFLNDPEIKKAGKIANSHIKDEFGDPEAEEMDDNPINASGEEYPLYNDEEDDTEIDEFAEPSGTTPEPAPASDPVKELDINELTDMVNSSVKETLSKYFQ